MKMNDAVTEVMDNAVADVTNAVGDAVPTDVTEKIGFVERYLNELPQKALNLGIRVVLALVFFFAFHETSYSLPFALARQAAGKADLRPHHCSGSAPSCQGRANQAFIVSRTCTSSSSFMT